MDTKKVLNWTGFVLSAVVAVSIIIFVGFAYWESLEWTDWLMVLFITPSIVISLLASWKIVNPTEVALQQWFGRLLRGGPVGVEPEPLTSKNGVFWTGLHFVPWFLGMRLRMIPKDQILLLFKRDPNKPSYEMSGTMFSVRSKDRQKLHIEATFFLRLPYDLVDSLTSIIESGVPIEDVGALREWVKNAFSPDVFAVLGDYDFAEVIGGLKNEDLNKRVNKLLQKPGSLLRRCGLFGNGPDDDTPGTGEADLKIEYVHVSGPLGERLEQVQTAKLEAEADKEAAIVQAEVAENTARIKARVIGRPVEIMLDEWVVGEAKRMGVDVPAATKALKKDGAYAKKEQTLHELRSRELAGGGTYNKEEIDINSGGQPLKDSNMAAFIGTIAGAATAWASAKGGGGGGQNPGNKGKKKKGRPNKDEEDDDDDEDEDLRGL